MTRVTMRADRRAEHSYRRNEVGGAGIWDFRTGEPRKVLMGPGAAGSHVWRMDPPCREVPGREADVSAAVERAADVLDKLSRDRIAVERLIEETRLP